MRITKSPAGMAAILFTAVMLRTGTQFPPNETASCLSSVETIPLMISSADICEEMGNNLFISLIDGESGRMTAMELEEYVVGVVAREMPASFHAEALCAQAIAARTYTLHKVRDGHICSDSAHCQAYADTTFLREQWGEAYEANMQRIQDAVSRTAGIIMTYGDKPIEALYHASSCGATSDASHVYAHEVSYLQSVSSPEPPDAHTRHCKWNAETLRKELTEALPLSDIPEPLQTQDISILSRWNDSRVNQVQIGNAILSGVELRRILKLPSACFTVTQEGDAIVFTCYGSGHGIGMSQEGAQILAEKGMLYPDILAHYYTGVTLEKYDPKNA